MADPGPTSEPGAHARWRLRLLGGFDLDDGRQRLTRLHSRAAVGLIARLAGFSILRLLPAARPLLRGEQTLYLARPRVKEVVSKVRRPRDADNQAWWPAPASDR